MKHYFSDRHDIGEADFGKIMEITEVDPIVTPFGEARVFFARSEVGLANRTLTYGEEVALLNNNGADIIFTFNSLYSPLGVQDYTGAYEGRLAKILKM